ncbi:MAG: hypothetical protein ABSG58_07755, partial [Acidimicrobiales bacterium]
MKSFDPDDDAPYVERDDDEGVQLGERDATVDADAALALLDRITRDLPGGGESREGQREMVRLVASAISRRRHHVIEAGT